MLDAVYNNRKKNKAPLSALIMEFNMESLIFAGIIVFTAGLIRSNKTVANNDSDLERHKTHISIVLTEREKQSRAA